jgi:tetratricopeptide (TPR) repeat protein
MSTRDLPTNRDELNLIDSDPGEWKRYVVLGVAFVLLAAAVSIGLLCWNLRYEIRQSEAKLMVSQAPTAQAKLEAIKPFLGEPYVAVDLMLIAADLMDQSQNELAVTAFAAFLRHYSSHPLRNGAVLGLASSKEAAGRQEQALQDYLSVGRFQPADAYNPVGLQNAARLYEVREDKTNAKAILTEIQQRFANTPYAQQAALEVARLDAPPPPPAPAVTAEPAPAAVETIQSSAPPAKTEAKPAAKPAKQTKKKKKKE